MKHRTRPASLDPQPAALISLRRAARNALALARRTKTSAYVLENGKIVDIAGRVLRSPKKHHEERRAKRSGDLG